MANNVKQVTVHFCTYRNKETQGQWHKSREYPTMEYMLRAMLKYLEKYPYPFKHGPCSPLSSLRAALRFSGRAKLTRLRSPRLRSARYAQLGKSLTCKSYYCYAVGE